MNPIRGLAPWAAVLLSAAHLVLAVVQRPAAETVVLTPFIAVEPDGAEGPPLSAEEGAALAARPGAADARDIARGYATLGSTLSLAELLAGVEALSGPQALDRRQQQEIGAILAAARDQHDELIDVQRRILDLEAAIQARVRRIQALRGGSPQPQRSAQPPGGRDGPR